MQSISAAHADCKPKIKIVLKEHAHCNLRFSWVSKARGPIGAALLGEGPMSWYSVAAFTAAAVVIAAISVATAREIHETPMKELGKKQ